MYIHCTCIHKKFKWGFLRACISRAVYLHVQLAIKEWPFRVLWLNLLLLFTQFQSSEHFRHKLKCIQCLAHVYWTALFCFVAQQTIYEKYSFFNLCEFWVEVRGHLFWLHYRVSEECQSQSAQKMRQFMCPGERFLFWLCNLLYSVLSIKRKWGCFVPAHKSLACNYKNNDNIKIKNGAVLHYN